MRESGEFSLAVCGGIIEVLPERITLLAQCAELPEEIDLARAEAAKERAVCRIRETGADIDHVRAELALKRAIMRIRVAQHKL
jgi:F-type H+-transporting ATPase subunit epsilon